ncbi:MAG TPA: beta-sandwich domain-containing protein [Bdellovibrio sp.]
MKRILITGAFAAVTMAQSISMAMDMLDLPDPGATGDAGMTSYASSVMTQVQKFYTGSVGIGSISRKSGGTLYTVVLSQPDVLQRLSLTVDASSLKIYETTLITDSGQRIPVAKLSNTGRLDTAAFLVTEDLGVSETIKSIEVLAESFSSEADITLKAVSVTSVPKMALQTAASLMLAQQQQQQQQPADGQPQGQAPAAAQADSVPAQTSIPQQAAAPQPPPPPAPLGNGSPSRDLRVGEAVIVPTRDFAKATVMGVNSYGYIVRFESTLLMGQMQERLSRSQLQIASGCYQDICVDDQLFTLVEGYDYALARVAGIDVDGKYTMQFLNGRFYMRYGTGWVAENLSTKNACGKSFCVRDYAYLEANANQIEYVSILAVDKSGKYVVRFEKGALAGRMGHSWSEKELAKTSGCAGRICVGQTVFVPSQNAEARILAIQNGGASFIIDFVSGPNSYRMGSGWRAEHFR